MPDGGTHTTLRLEPFEALWRCDGCGMEQITPREDPPANCPRCQHPSVFWVRSGNGVVPETCSCSPGIVSAECPWHD